MRLKKGKFIRLRYDTIEEFNVDSKAEYCIQLNLAHVAETKTNNASAPLIQNKIRSVTSVRKE